MTREEKLALIDRCSAKAEAYKEICDLVALHVYHQRMIRPEDELKTCWSKREDISYYGICGRKAVEDYYCAYTRSAQEKKMEYLAKAWPGFKVCEENRGAGDMVASSATTPYVIVAEDGQTAQGIWFCIGLFVEPDVDGMPKPFYDQRRLAADFVKEDGAWKIWHLDYYLDFQTPLPRHLFVEEQYAGRTAKMFEDDETPAPGMGPSSEEEEQGNPFPPPYTPTKVPVVDPPIPEPYDTWDNSMRFEM